MSRRKREKEVQRLQQKMEKAREAESAALEFTSYRESPVQFVREVLGAEEQDYQGEVLADCTESPRVAWRAGHGVGKTTTLSWILLWWLLTRVESRALVVAPAFKRQVEKYFFGEVSRWVDHSPHDLPLEMLAGEIRVAGLRRWSALAIQASEPEKVEGGHAQSLCVLADEAKGLSSEVVAALHGTQTDVGGDHLYVLASTPGGPSGPFYDVFRKGRDLWSLHHTSALESDLVSQEGWVEPRKQEWGENSPMYTMRVLGNFPEEDEWTVFPLSLIEAAQGRELEPREEDEPEPEVWLGVDVGKSVDPSAIAVWRGKRLMKVMSKQGLGALGTATWAHSVANRHGADRLRVDETGMGEGTVERLHQMARDADYVVDGLKAGRSAEDNDQYANRRAELFWQLRNAMEREEVALPEHCDDLKNELAALRYEIRAGKTALKSKKEVAKRVGHSPDLADAAALGFPAGGGTRPWLMINGRVVR